MTLYPATMNRPSQVESMAFLLVMDDRTGYTSFREKRTPRTLSKGTAMRFSPVCRFATRFTLALLLVSLLTPRALLTQDFDEDTEEDRTEQLMDTILAVLQHSAAHRSLLDDVDPIRGARFDRMVAYKLRTTRVSLKLEDHRVEDVLDFLRRMSGVNFVISPKAREVLEADEESVSLLLDDLTLENLLNLLDRRLKETRFTVRYGAVMLVRNDEYRPRRILRFYEIRDIVRRPPDFPAPRLGLGGVEPEGR